MYTFQALQILIFLIPGFIVTNILEQLIVRSEKNEFGKIVEALIFSMIIYTIYSFLNTTGPISFSDNNSIKYNSESFIYLLGISIIMPIILGLFITNDWHMKFARFVKITRSTSRSSVWYDIFCDNQKYIIINFENGRRLFGWPMDYSDSPEKSYLFLHNPSWIVIDEKTKKQKYIDLNIYGILITPEQKIESIEFLNTK